MRSYRYTNSVLLSLTALSYQHLILSVNSFVASPTSRTPLTCHRKQSENTIRTCNRRAAVLQGQGVSEAESSATEFQDRCYLDQTSVELSFPDYGVLMDCDVGDCVTSDPFECGDHSFCVKLYPRGGGHGGNSGQQASGFGMAYKILPMFPNPNVQNQRVGVYLQYLGDESVDATFRLRLQGNQQMGRKFDVDWRAGMRFVPHGKTKLAKGVANDFGAHLMQTPLLKEFMGLSEEAFNTPTPLIASVEIIVHDTDRELVEAASACDGVDAKKDEPPTTSFFGAVAQDVRIPEDASRNSVQHNGEQVRVGSVVVPILTQLSTRPKLMAQGTYPGVEYRILRILKDGQVRFTSCPGCEYELRPIYPLVVQLERPWPVRVHEQDIPRLYTPNMYNAVSAVGSLLTAITGLSMAFLLSQCISLFFIPSRSMDPTLQVGDVLLVDKVSPRVLHNQKAGDIVLFSPPGELRDIVSANGGRLTSRDLFVKRIAAQQGDKVQVNAAGQVQINGAPASGRRDLCQAEPLRLIEKYVKSNERVLESSEYFLMGDCSSVSIDSRVWGPLQATEIIGKPILRLWPLDRFGALATLQQPLATTVDNWSD